VPVVAQTHRPTW